MLKPGAIPNTENGSLCAYVACARSSSHALGVTEVWLSVPTVMVLCAPGQCTVAHEWTTSAASRARLTTTRARKCNIVECCTADSGTSWQQKYVDVIPHTTAGPRALWGFGPAHFRQTFGTAATECGFTVVTMGINCCCPQFAFLEHSCSLSPSPVRCLAGCFKSLSYDQVAAYLQRFFRCDR